MTAPLPREPDFVEHHRTMDERLDEAFQRYDAAYRDHSDLLVEARLNLSLLLWSEDDEPPAEVRTQLKHDAEILLRETPPLPEGS